MTHAYLKAQSAAPNQFCQKIAFDTRQHARRAAGKMPNKRLNVTQHSTHGTLQVYLCKFCSHYHIGHGI